MTFGLTSTGFLRKRLNDIEGELQAAYRSAFGDAVKVTGDSVMGQLIGIQAERLAELWELSDAVYSSAFPDTASAANLDNVVAVTGHARLGATFSTVTVTCATTGGSPVTLPIGRQIRVTATGATFATLTQVIIPASGSVTVECRATVAGEVAAPAGTLTEIVTPVSGWTSATNAADAEVGRDQETDADLRIRRRSAMVIAQAGGIEAIENRLLGISGVEFAGVTENRTDTTDGNGRPPHSFEATVVGGATTAIGQMIWDTKPAGIATFGGVTVAITDTFGNPQNVFFSRPTPVSIYCSLAIATSSAFVASMTTVRGLVVDAINDLANGDDVTPFALQTALTGVSGILSVSLSIGRFAGPTVPNTPVSILISEIATTSLAQVTA